MNNVELAKDVVKFFNDEQSTIKDTANHFSISEDIVLHYLTCLVPNEISLFILRRNNEIKHDLYCQTIKNKLSTTEKDS